MTIDQANQESLDHIRMILREKDELINGLKKKNELLLAVIIRIKEDIEMVGPTYAPINAHEIVTQTLQEIQ